MGGGPDVDQAFQWLIERAGIKPGTGGRLVIIQATGTEAYNPYITTAMPLAAPLCLPCLARTAGSVERIWA